MNNHLVSLNLNSTKNSALQKSSTVSSNIVNLNLLNKNHIQGVKSDFQADFNELNLTEKEYTFEELMEYADKQLENMKAAGRMETVINDIGDIDPNDINDIQRALSIYNSLTDEQKRCVSSDVKAKLDNAIEDYNEAVNNANEVVNAINDIGTIDLNSKVEIDKAWTLYNSLTEEQKAFLSTETLNALNAAQYTYDIKVKEKELGELYKERKDNNGFFHPIKENETDDRIKQLEKELGVPHQPDGFEKFCDTVGSTYATVAITATSVVSGVAKVGETVVDGCIWLGGTAVSGTAELFGADEFADSVQEATMDAIAFDAVGEANKAFYENTSLGKSINDASYMKYDSELAQGIQNVTETVTVAAAATALTVVSGGAAAAAFGGLYAAGNTAEQKFQDTENRDFWGDSLEIGIDGVIGAANSYGTGQAGAALCSGVKALSSIGFNGVKELAKNQVKNFSKEVLTNTIKDQGKNILKQTAINTLKDSDTWIDTGCVLLDNVKSGITTGEWDVTGMFMETAGIYASNFVGNLGANYLNLANESRVIEKNVDVQLNSTRNIEVDTPSRTKLNSAPSIIGTNSIKDYTFDRDGYINYVNELVAEGYSDRKIVEQLAVYGNRCSDIATKRAFADFSYEALLAWGYDQKTAANMLQDIYQTQLNERGMSCVMIIDGIKYNAVNDFNYDNQAYTIEHVREQLRAMPREVREKVTEVNLYDTFNPDDYYWNSEYKSDGSYFRSAATGGDGQINIWANDYTHQSIIFHESGHCFDEVIGYNSDGSAIRLHSDSQEYLQAIYADAQLTGKQSITDYGENNPAEDFAETMAAYHGGFSEIDINQFPNRKAYIEKHIKVTGQQYLSVHNCNMLNVVSNTISQKYGADQVIDVLYQYVTTGNLNIITRENGARNMVASMDINEVIEYYNLLVGGI